MMRTLYDRRHPLLRLHLRVAVWCLVGWLGLITCTLSLQAADGWHNPASPYRAVFDIKSQPNHARGGYFIEVPVCGLGDPDGKQVWVFSEAGKQLRSRALGRTRDNRALVVVGDDAPLSGKLYAYFGGTRAAPQDSNFFIPGPTVDIRTCKPDGDVESLENSTKLFNESKIIGVLPVSQIYLGDNPLTLDDAFIMDFHGAILAPQAGPMKFVIATDDAGYFYVRDKLVITRNGRHFAGDANGAPGTPADLVAGPNPFRLLVLDVGGGQVATLFRFVDERNRPLMKPDEFVQSGGTSLAAVEARANLVCPAFTVIQQSYIDYDNVQLTELKLRALGGQPLEWVLDNGATAEGVEVTKIIVGRAPLKISARPAERSGGRDVAEGECRFIGVPPAYSIFNWGQYVAYRDAIAKENLGKLNAATLEGYFAFFAARERNPDGVATGLALSATWKTDRYDKRQRGILLELARAASGPAPETAHDVYRSLLKGRIREESRDEVATEYLEFELFRGSAPERFTKALEQNDDVFEANDPRLAVIRAVHGMLTGQRDEAERYLGELRTRLTRDDQSRRFAVQGNAAVERFRIDAGAGFYARAESDLRTWIAMDPEALTDGQYALLASAYFRRIGWADSGLKLIDATLAYNELPAFLPDLEFEKATVLNVLGRVEEARELYTKVAQTYPNHPVAAQARAALDKLPAPASAPATTPPAK